MCNLYRMTKATAEVAHLFSVDPVSGSNAGEEVYPGWPGLVFDGETLRTMTWGFPLVLKGKSGQPLKPKPVNNARTDKLASFMWRYSFAERRCLIPLTSFAEAEGPIGHKTRTWFSLPDQSIFTVAGIWRDSDEWGPVYSMIVTDANETISFLHDRMPVLISPEDRAVWLRTSLDKAKALCVPYAGEMSVDRTSQPWVTKR